MGARKGTGKVTGVKRIVTLQPSEYVDHIAEDGHEFTKLPYPFHVQQDGLIERQDFWRGEPLRAVGFVADLAKQQVDVWWADAVKHPEKVVGMYLVTANKDGDMQTQVHAISEARPYEHLDA